MVISGTDVLKKPVWLYTLALVHPACHVIPWSTLKLCTTSLPTRNPSPAENFVKLPVFKVSKMVQRVQALAAKPKNLTQIAEKTDLSFSTTSTNRHTDGHIHRHTRTQAHTHIFNFEKIPGCRTMD